MIRRYSKHSDIRVSKYFVAREFDCPCERPDCRETLIDDDLLAGLDRMREDLGTPIFIGRGGGHRCEGYQVDLTVQGYETAKKSQHPLGKAADPKTGVHTGVELEAAARRAGFTSVGVGTTFVHVDIRPGYRRWVYQRAG